MSDKMRMIAFETLLLQSVEEYRQSKSLFGVPVKREKLNSPLGPAAGPHTQLSQNLVAAFAAGANHFELKTVQVLSGEDLHIKKPCIYVEGEAYNTEWSSELKPQEAAEEYIRGWFMIHLLAREFELPGREEVKFYMSVGYDYQGITSVEIDGFLDSMLDASHDKTTWVECKDVVLRHLEKFERVTKEDVAAVPTLVSDTVVISTMHGCPVMEIEKIAKYLLVEKHLHVYLKCNPTLVGYEVAKQILSACGYGYMNVTKESFAQDIDYVTLVSLIHSLQITANKEKRIFGVKLTNTFPIKIQNRELEGESMYMSGPALYPLSIRVAAMLAQEFKDTLPISYCGGVDVNNVEQILRAGLYPVTVSTLLLKQGGYKNITRLNARIQFAMETDAHTIDVDALQELADHAVADLSYHKKAAKRNRVEKPQDKFCSLCTNCVDVCPNRANVAWKGVGRSYVIHIDSRCNECGNCSHFCIRGENPYLDKFTLFDTEEDSQNSDNVGVVTKFKWDNMNIPEILGGMCDE